MLFTSFTFIVFQIAVFALRWALPRRFVGPLLLVASYVFYLSWQPKYGLLIFGMTITSWGAARAIERVPRHKGKILAATVVLVLSLLSYFKYANFLASQMSTILAWAGVRSGVSHFDVILPLAISFYSFEVISYVVDVYRGEAAEPSLWEFALYVSYYPHLIAGPIVRAHELLPQLRNPKAWDGAMFSEGMFIMLVGYLKKMVLADNLSPWADEVFGHPSHYSTFGVWFGVIAYTGQIYCDFSGYTDIARGASITIGYTLPDNFDYPYLSESPTEFWRRWHMTLSRWLRDYLYIPLGGNRGGRFRQYRNLFLTMLLGGLWHGASWTFVVWGAFHGGLLAAHKAWGALLSRVTWSERLRSLVAYRVFAWAATMVLVMIGWVFFRAQSFTVAATVLWRMFHAVPGVGTEPLTGERPAALGTAMIFTAGLVLLHLFGRYRVGTESNRLLPPMARGILWSATVVICYLFARSNASFIYFQF